MLSAHLTEDESDRVLTVSNLAYDLLRRPEARAGLVGYLAQDLPLHLCEEMIADLEQAIHNGCCVDTRPPPFEPV